MEYTADFKTFRVPGDMFQSMNGDVWKVLVTDGWLPSPTRTLFRQTVRRIWQYKLTKADREVLKSLVP